MNVITWILRIINLTVLKLGTFKIHKIRILNIWQQPRPSHSHTCYISSSSIICYRPKGGDAMRPGSNGSVRLQSFTCTFCDGSESETTLLCVRCWSSAVCNHQFSVPVLADVRRRRSRSAHARRRALDGAAREEISADEERQRGTENLAITACFLAAGGVYVNDVLFFFSQQRRCSVGPRVSLQNNLSVRFNGLFPGESGLAGNRMSSFWISVLRNYWRWLYSTAAPILRWVWRDGVCGCVCMTYMCVCACVGGSLGAVHGWVCGCLYGSSMIKRKLPTMIGMTRNSAQ